MSTEKLTKTQADLAIKPAINSLAQSSMFWRPDYLRHSPWLEHVPFLFWLVEAHQPQMAVTLGMKSGVAHFALCQAVQRLRLGTRCYATFRERGDAVYPSHQEVSDYHDSRFDSFSYFLDGSSVRAASQFEDGSIDLLLLNPVAEERLEDLLVRWQPKLSTHALVLVPGISKRDPGCDTFRAFEAMAQQYPTYIFHHGDGLGAISVGGNLGPLLNNLFDPEVSTSAQQVVREVFGRLGRTCRDALLAREYLQKAEALEASLAEQKLELDQLSAEYESTCSELNAKREELAGFGQRMEQVVASHAQERGQLAERVSMLQEFRDDLKSEASQLRQRLDEQYRNVDVRNQQLLQLQASYADQLQELAKWQGRSELDQASTEQVSVLNQRLQVLETELAGQRASLTERHKELATLTELLEAKEQELTQQVAALNKREGALATQKILSEVATSELVEKERQRQQAEDRVKELEARLADAERGAETRDRVSRELEERIRVKEEALATAEASLEERYRELAALTGLLEESGQKKIAEEAQESSRALQSATRIRELEGTVADLERELQSGDSRSQDLEKRLKSVEQERDSLKVELAHRQHRMQGLENALAAANNSVNERFRELAVLTQMLEAREEGHNTSRGGAAARTSERSKTQANAALLGGITFGKRAKKLRKQRKELELIVQSGLFDADWYLSLYPDVAEDRTSARNPALHYLKFGAFEGRNPSPDFDSQWYLDTNPDVKDSGFNPLVHYVSLGREEGRLPLPY